MKTCRLLLLSGSLCAPLITGCSTREEVAMGVGMTAFMATAVVLAPAVPVVNAYHKITDADGKALAETERLEALLDPVYAQRIAIIEERSPEADADALLQKGKVLYFPSFPGNTLTTVLHYPGVHDVWEGPPDPVANQELIQDDELASALWSLLARDPSHPKYNEGHYYSDVYEQFVDAHMAYIKRFNLHMYHNRQDASPTPPVSPAEEWWLRKK